MLIADAGFFYALADRSDRHHRRALEVLERIAGPLLTTWPALTGLPMDLADASLLLLAEHLDDGRILSTDRRDFQTCRFKNHTPFRNLLLED